MNPKSKEARKRLKEATRKEFDDLVYGSMLTPIQEEILRMHICKGMTIVSIAVEKSYSEGFVRSVLSQIYKRVSKI
jgi:DNA-binding NarL/FixJ family response regulator